MSLTYCKPFQMGFFCTAVQQLSSWQEFNWRSVSRGPSAISGRSFLLGLKCIKVVWRRSSSGPRGEVTGMSPYVIDTSRHWTRIARNSDKNPCYKFVTTTSCCIVITLLHSHGQFNGECVSCIRSPTSMSVLLIVSPKCMLAASHAAPWWVTYEYAPRAPLTL